MNLELTQVTEEFLIYLSAVKKYSEHTLRSYKVDYEYLNKALQSLYGVDSVNIADITTEDLRALVGKLVKAKYSVARVNRFIAAIKSLFAYCKRLGYININPSFEVKTLKRSEKLPRFMTEPEVNALCNKTKDSNLLWQSRDEALFKMLYSSGCRVSEMANLKLSDFSYEYKSARVLGKGRKMRYVFFSADAIKALKAYLPERNAKIKAEKKVEHVFINQHGTALSASGIEYIVSTYSSFPDENGVVKHVSPHAFRHTFATTMLNHGADIRVVQEMLGHSSISATQRYTHITASKLIEIYNRAHPHGKE